MAEESFVPLLLIKKPDQPEERFELTQPVILVGRIQTNAITILGDTAISREHCRFEYDKDKAQLCLIDLGSSNGTYLNGQPIEGGPHLLKTGDKVQVGATILKYILDRSTVKVHLPTPAQPNTPMPRHESEGQMTRFDFSEFVCTCGRCGNKIPITAVQPGDKVGCRRCRAVWVVPA